MSLAPALAPEEPPPFNGRSPFTLVESLIVAGLLLLGLAVALVRPLLPIFESPATPAWVHPIQRPALLWGGMGFLLLAVGGRGGASGGSARRGSADASRSW